MRKHQEVLAYLHKLILTSLIVYGYSTLELKGGEIMVKLGTLMKACRERANLSQEELAHRMNRTQACISKFEHDHKVPDANTFAEWFRLTNSPEVAIAFLYGMDGLTILHQLLPIVGAIAIWFI